MVKYIQISSLRVRQKIYLLFQKIWAKLIMVQAFIYLSNSFSWLDTLTLQHYFPAKWHSGYWSHSRKAVVISSVNKAVWVEVGHYTAIPNLLKQTNQYSEFLIYVIKTWFLLFLDSEYLHNCKSLHSTIIYVQYTASALTILLCIAYLLPDFCYTVSLFCEILRYSVKMTANTKFINEQLQLLIGIAVEVIINKN